jgi:hypothetical protein
VVVKRLKKRLRIEVYLQFVEVFNALFTKFSDFPDEDLEEDQVGCFSIACFLYPSSAFTEEEQPAPGDAINA